MPAAMKNALATAPRARAAFNALPPSHRSEYVKWITEAKREETVRRRIRKLIPMLLVKRHAAD